VATPTPDVKAVFDQAAEIDSAADREAYLAEACDGFPDVRRQVDALLKAYVQAGSFLDRNVLASVDPALLVQTDTVDRLHAEVGTVVAGKYKLLQEVGEGGMGSVFMADQLHPVKRRVAVKVIRAGMDSKSVLARFEAERQALALMDHPNIARVLDAGTTDAGGPFFVMELVKGIPLTQFCDEHRLPVLDRLNLFMQICSAVQHAHQKGIIHRDLKPTNILVESHDGKPVPKVIDFGLAKATGGMPLTEHTLFTALGTVAGTPLYMAPEQAAFNAIDVDTRADIYALGVILHELLTGTTPIERETFKTAAFDEMLRVIREQDPPTPSSRLSNSETKANVAAVRQMEPAKLGRFVRGELDWIVMKALAKERDRRYESATAFAKDIERFLNHEAVAAGPPTVRYKLQKFIRRNKGLLSATALVAIVLVVGTGVSIWQAVRATRAKTDADGQRVRAEKNFGRAMGAVDQMLTRVGEKRLAMVPQMEDERQKLLQDALHFYQDFLADEGDDPRVRQEVARAHQRIGRVHQLLGQGDQAKQSYDQALDLQRILIDRFPNRPEYRRDQAVTYRGLGGLLRGAGRTGAAEAAYRQAIELLKPLADEYSEATDYLRDLGTTYDSLGQLYQETGRLEPEAAKALQGALAIRQQLADSHSETADFQIDLARSHVRLGLLYRDQGEKLKSQQSLNAAQDFWKALISQNGNVPEYRNELARVDELRGALHREAGEVDPAETALRSALSIRSKLADEHPKVLEYQDDRARTHNGLCELYRLADRRRPAEVEVENALRILEPLREKYPDEFAFAISLGVACAEKAAVLRMVAAELPELEKRATFWESIAWCDRSMTHVRDVRAKELNHAEARKVQSNAHMARAEAYVHLGRRDDAVKDWESMAELGNDQSHAELLSFRALGLANLGRYTEATDVVRKMRAEGREPVYSQYNFVCVYSRSIGAVQDDSAVPVTDRRRLADAYWREALEILNRIKAAGFFKESAAVAYMKTDSDLDPVRGREDFKKLMAEMEKKK
jgi:eukaryotic-like serine/threonine-protein kinase